MTPKSEALRVAREALTRLLQVFPTDIDMAEAGWNSREIDDACNAYDAAQSALRTIKSEEAHTDHPSRHWDRTCSGCNPAGVQEVDPLNDTQAELDAITLEMDVIYERWPKKEDRAKREELLTPLRARCVGVGQRRYRIAASGVPEVGRG